MCESCESLRVQATCRTHRPHKLKRLISLCTNPVSILSVPIQTVRQSPQPPLNRLNAIFVLAVDRIAKSPHLFNWSSAIGLYGWTWVGDELTRTRFRSGLSPEQCGLMQRRRDPSNGVAWPVPKAANPSRLVLAPQPPGNTVRSFSTHGQQSAAKGSSTTVSRFDIRLIQHLDSSAHVLVRMSLFIGCFLIIYYTSTTSALSLDHTHSPADPWPGAGAGRWWVAGRDR
jgi:hypothetical protein